MAKYLLAESDGNPQYRGSVFKVPTMTNWMIIASGRDKVEEIRRAPDDVLSMRDAIEGVILVSIQFSEGHLTLLRFILFEK